jgi:hypothetical protein
MEISPAVLLLLSVSELVEREPLHCAYVLLYFLFVEIWNSNLCKVHYQEPFDGIPVLDVSLPLGDALKDGLLLPRLTTLGLEYTLVMEFALS